jgi:prevent-host-death family protein
MPREVSATEAKNRLGALLSWVTEENDEVIIEHQGKPRAVIISISEYEKVKAEREQKRRAEALARIQRLREEISVRNRDMTPEQVEEFANRVRHDVVQSLMEKRALRFEE